MFEAKIRKMNDKTHACNKREQTKKSETKVTFRNKQHNFIANFVTQNKALSAMKKIILLLVVVSVSWQVKAQQKQDKTSGAVIVFDRTNHDFGKIFYRSDGTYQFKFVNAGKEPLLLSKPRSSCGCTVPSWPKAPILPGDSGSIKVTYNTHIIGKFNKSVTVYSNASKPVVLRIHGEVVPRPKPLVPVKQTDKSATPVKK